MSEHDACLFCSIVAGKIPAKKVAESTYTLAFHDIHPAAPVHVLIIPKKHIHSMSELVSEDAAIIADIMLQAKIIAAELGVAEENQGYRFVINTGADAGQSVLHLHAHILAGRGLAWPPG